MAKRRIKDGPGQILLDLTRRIEPGLEKPIATVPVSQGEVFLVDGANVISAVNGKPRLEVLLALVVGLKRAGGEFCCIFDANVGFRLRKSSGVRVCRAYGQLLDTCPRHFVESTGGLRADELLLQRANVLKQRIITNDRFNDARERYPWLNDEDKHLVKLVVVGEEVQVPALDIFASWNRKFGDLARELIRVIGG